MINKKLAAAFAAICAVSLAGAFALSSVNAAAEQTWTYDPAYWTENDDGTFTGTNDEFMKNYLLTADAAAAENYTLEATVKGTTDVPAGEIQYGVVAWMQDAQNYVLVSLKWDGANAHKTLLNAQILNCVDGAYDWNDMWLDHSELNAAQLKPSDTLAIKVERMYNETTKLDDYALTINDEFVRTSSFAESVGKASAQVGAYTFHETLTVSSLEVTAETTEIPSDNTFGGYTWNANSAYWTINEDKMEGRGDHFTGEFATTAGRDAVGNYTVEATLQGSAESANRAGVSEINIGLVPWYLNAKNYVVIYMQWSGSNAHQTLLNMQAICIRDGESQGWNDCWLDNSTLECRLLKPNAAIAMKVERTYDATTNADAFAVYVGTELVRTISFELPAVYAAYPNAVGIYAHNDVVSVKSFSVTAASAAGAYDGIAGTAATGKSSSAAGWTYAEGVYGVDASAGTTDDNRAILPNDVTGNYSISYTSIVKGNAGELSVLPWYSNEKNYVQFCMTTSRITVKGMLDGVAFSELPVAVSYTSLSALQIRAEKIGTSVSLYVGDTLVASYRSDSLLNSANVGFGAGGAAVSFADVAVETVQYRAYDWYLALSENRSYYLSASEQDKIIIDSSSIVMTAEEDAEKTTRLYTATNLYDRIAVTGKFTAASAACSYGIYAYYVSDTEYIRADVLMSKVVVSWHIGESKSSVEEALTGFDMTTTNLLSVSFDAGKVSVKINDKVVVADFAVEAAAEIRGKTGSAGLIAVGGEIVVEEFGFDGFTPYMTYTKDGWTYKGARLDSWQKQGDDLIGSFVGGTSFMQTIAFTSSELLPRDGYFVSSQITVTAGEKEEYKTGFMAYYGDSSNYVYVWLSQWANGKAMICITAVLDGRTVGNQWRETEVSYTYLNTLHYFEVNVHGDTIDVYLDRNYSAVASTTIEGLGNVTKGGYGVNIHNTCASFAGLKISRERQYLLTEDPAIEVVGTLPSTVKVGASVKLPVFSASTVSGDTVTVEIEIKGPDSSAVALENNRFTAAKAGQYTVFVTAKDVWGNSITEEYHITAKNNDDSTGGGTSDTASEGSAVGGCKSGCGSTMAVGISLTAVSMAVAVLFLNKKSRLNK